MHLGYNCIVIKQDMKIIYFQKKKKMKCKKEKSYTDYASFFKLFGSISLKQTGSSLANTPPSKNIFWNLSFGLNTKWQRYRGKG